MKLLKTLVAATAAFGVVATAQAGVTVSGHVNQIAIIDASGTDDITILDNTTAASRFRMKASKKFGGLKAGIRYELAIVDAKSTNGNDDLTNDGGEVRYSDVWLSGDFGKVGLGKGDGAANGTFESYALLGHYMAGDLARIAVSGVTPVSYRSIDGISRQNRIRYDSPKFSGLKFAASIDNGDETEVAVFYDGKVAGGKLRARFGSVSEAEVTSMSAAYKHGSGFGAALAIGENDASGLETNWVTLSYQAGKTIFQYNFGTSETAAGAEHDMNVLGINYKPTKGVEMYLNIVGGTNDGGAQDPDATYIGSRVLF